MSYEEDDFDLSNLLKMFVAAEKTQAPIHPEPQIVVPTIVEAPKATRPKRCQMDQCKAKLLLTDSACKCSGIYCMTHRHAETHKCTFNFRASGAADLGKRLVAVSAAKLEKF